MHLVILWSCAIVTVAVFGVMIHSIASFRANGRRSLVEVLWALVPIAIFIGAALPAVRMIEAGSVRMAEAAK